MFEIHLASFGNSCKYKVWIVCKYSSQGRCIPACVPSERERVFAELRGHSSRKPHSAPLQLTFFIRIFFPFLLQRRNRGATCVCLCAALVLLAYWIGLHFSPRVQIVECAERKRIGSQGDASKEQIALSVRGTCFIIMNSRRTRPLSCSIWEAVLTFS